MRIPAVCLLAVAALAATAFGQTLEKTIWLPDSNIELEEAKVVFHNPVTNRVYFASYWTEWIQVYDANTGEKAWRVDSSAYSHRIVHCYNEHQIWALTDEGYILVFDDLTDSIKASLDFEWAGDIAYNAAMGKAYVLDLDWDRVIVYDVATLARIDSIQLHDWPDFIAWDSVYNRVYVLGWDWEYYPIVAIDCTQDSIAEVMRGPITGDYMLVHPSLPKLYCVGTDDSCMYNQLWVYDTRDLSVDTVITLPVGWWCPGYLMLNPANNMLYAGYREYDYPFRHRRENYEDTVAVFDCSEDTLVGCVALPERFGTASFCVNESNCKVYIGSFRRSSVAVLGVPDSITKWIRLHQAITGMGWNPSDNEVYLAGEYGYVWVLDGATDSVIDGVDYEGRYVSSMTWCSHQERLYVADWEGVGWVGAGDSLGYWYWFDGWESGGLLAFSSSRIRLYFKDVSQLRVYDCVEGRVVHTAQLPSGQHRCGIALDNVNKLYLPTEDGECTVYDTDRDVVRGKVPGYGTCFKYQPANSRVYGWGHDDQVTLIDPVTDSTVASVSDLDVRDLEVNTSDNEVYFFVADHPTDVFVMDGMTHEVEQFASLGSDLRGLLWVDSLDLLACITVDTTYLVDRGTRQVVRSYQRGNRFYNAWALDRANSILYDGTPPYRVTAMHCGMDSAVVFGVAARQFCCDEDNGGMFGAFDNTIHIFSYDPVGMHSQKKSKVQIHEELPTIVRGVLELPQDMTGQNGDCPSEGGPVPALLDAAGRVVTYLQPGPNDIRHIAPGVYFVMRPETEDGRPSTAVRKVVIQR